jgi:S-DNA-T family DNA segregation ATPase FtsK/SpoIIIE
MPASSKRSRAARRSPAPAPAPSSRPVPGAILLLAAFLSLLALATYSWRDISFLASGPDAVNDPLHNAIGPVGAYFAFGVFMTLGVAGYLLPLLFLVWGILLFSPRRAATASRVLWSAAILAALAVLFDMNGAFWNRITSSSLAFDGSGRASFLSALNLESFAGGLAGHFLGASFLTRYLGAVGAGLLATGIVVVGLFMVLRLHPTALAEWWRDLRDRLSASQAARATERERIAEAEARGAEKARAAAERDRRAAAKAAAREERRRIAGEKAAARAAAKEARAAAKAAAAERREREEAEKQARREAFLARIAEEQAREKAEARKREEEAREAAKRRAEAEAPAEEPVPAPAAAAQPAPAPAKPAARKPRAAVRSGGDADAAAVAAEAPAEREATKWVLPPMSLLQPIPESAGRSAGADSVQENIDIIQRTLAEFNIDAQITHVEQGPSVTRYELLPAAGLRLNIFHSLAPNLTLALKAQNIRILTPVPGKGVVGFEVPNPSPRPVVLRELTESVAWTTSHDALPLAVGVDVGGKVLVMDLAKLPHLLIAGATGMGKTVCMNSLLAGLLLTRTPDELRLILVDPKIVEFADYNGLPHLLFPVITDDKRVVAALHWATREMHARFQLFATLTARDIKVFNAKAREMRAAAEARLAAAKEAAEKAKAEMEADPEKASDTSAAEELEEATKALAKAPKPIPYIVIIIDELADLMIQNGKEIEPQIQRLTQLARATGIHMILATQRPSVNVITGTIKANVPGRIAFRVAQQNDSRVVLDQTGADKLVGKGDMLVVAGGSRLVRAQGAWTKDEEIAAIAAQWKSQSGPAPYIATAKLVGGGKELPEEGGGEEGDGGEETLETDEGTGFTPAPAAKPAKPASAAGGFGGLDELDEIANESEGGGDGEDDELVRKALGVIRTTQRASTSSIQRRLRIGYTRAARVMDLLEEKGYIGPSRGAEPREILFDLNSPGPGSDE